MSVGGDFIGKTEKKPSLKVYKCCLWRPLPNEAGQMVHPGLNLGTHMANPRSPGMPGAVKWVQTKLNQDKASFFRWRGRVGLLVWFGSRGRQVCLGLRIHFPSKESKQNQNDP